MTYNTYNEIDLEVEAVRDGIWNRVVMEFGGNLQTNHDRYVQRIRNNKMVVKEVSIFSLKVHHYGEY